MSVIHLHSVKEDKVKHISILGNITWCMRNFNFIPSKNFSLTLLSCPEALKIISFEYIVRRKAKQSVVTDVYKYR